MDNVSNYFARLLRAQTLTVTFKKPFDLLAETTIAVRSTSDVSAQCARWWCLLTLARTVLDENPAF